MSKTPVGIEPGKYTVVLEPAALADLLVYLLFSMRCPAGGRRSQLLLEERWRQPSRRADRRREGAASIPIPRIRWRRRSSFDGEGLPIERNIWVEKGVLKDLLLLALLGAEDGQGSRPAGPST